MENEKTETSNEKSFEQPVIEAPLIKEKKKLTEQQIEILKRGREKLAAKRKDKSVQTEKEPAKDEHATEKPVETTPVVQPKVKRKYTKHPRVDETMEKSEDKKEVKELTEETSEKRDRHTERVIERPVVIEKNKDEGIIILALIGIIGVMLFLLFKYLKSKENGTGVSLGDTSDEVEPSHPNAVTRDGAYPVMNPGGNIE